MEQKIMWVLQPIDDKTKFVGRQPVAVDPQTGKMIWKYKLYSKIDKALKCDSEELAEYTKEVYMKDSGKCELKVSKIAVMYTLANEDVE